AEATGNRYAQTPTAGVGAAVMKKLFLASLARSQRLRRRRNCRTRRRRRFRWRTTIGLAPMSASTWAGRTITSRTISRRRAPSPDVTTGDHNAIFGFHAGAQAQWGAWVLGAEVARSECVHECRSTSSVLPVSQGFEPNIFGQHKLIDLFTAGAPRGDLWGRLVGFAAPGVVSGHIEN